MQYQVLARKYRPRQLQQVVGQQHVVRALSNALSHQQLHHAYLFTGTRGIGKTTIARIFAKCLNCERGISATPCNQCGNCQEIDAGRFPDFFEVDAASRTKVEDTRELLDNIQYSPSKGRQKIYLVDEVHMLSGHSFNALLKTLEEPPEHVKFLLATTDHQKLPATVLSRCLQFHLHAVNPDQISEHLADLLTQENVSYDATALSLIARAANGSLRDALSLLDQCVAFGNGKALEADVRTILGTIEPTTLFKIVDALSERDGTKLVEYINQLSEQGVDFHTTLSDLLTLLHEINKLQLVPAASCDDYLLEKQALAKKLSAEDVQLFYQIGIIGQRDFNFAPSPAIAFEMTLLRMLAFYPENEHAGKVKKPTLAKQHSQPNEKITDNSNWSSMIANLGLTGATAALAKNCSLEQLNQNAVILTVTEKQRALVLPRAIQRISEALSQHLGRPVKVKINIGETSQKTPAQQRREQIEVRKQSAKASLTNDPKVQQMMQAFNATLAEESIQTHHERASN